MTEELDPKIYPIGKVNHVEFTKEVLYRSIIMIEAAPLQLKKVLESINDSDLELTYREGGWNIRQIVHHLADAHMNLFIRFKLALTEETPTIKPFNVNAWAETKDISSTALESSVILFEGIQQRMSALLKVMSEDDFKRTYYRDDTKVTTTLAQITQTYAWHGLHHISQIEGRFK